MSLGYLLLSVLRLIYQLLDFAILAYVLLSWFVRPGTKLAEVYMFLARILEPVMGPIRRIMQPLTYRIRLDFSPWVTMILLSFVYRLLSRLILMLLV